MCRNRHSLVFVKPLGFSLSDRQLKRAGLDYWEHLDYTVVEEVDWEEAPTYFFSTHGHISYHSVKFESNCRLVFGPESSGLPKELLARFPQQVVKIPMLAGRRSLNLSNSVAIALYEALRQHHFKELL